MRMNITFVCYDSKNNIVQLWVGPNPEGLTRKLSYREVSNAIAVYPDDAEIVVVAGANEYGDEKTISTLVDKANLWRYSI